MRAQPCPKYSIGRLERRILNANGGSTDCDAGSWFFDLHRCRISLCKCAQYSAGNKIPGARIDWQHMRHWHDCPAVWKCLYSASLWNEMAGSGDVDSAGDTNCYSPLFIHGLHILNFVIAPDQESHSSHNRRQCRKRPMEHESTDCYRMRSHFRNVGLICTAFFAVVGLVTTFAAYFNVDGSVARPKLAALIFGLFWSAFTLLGIWLLLLYHRYRLYFNDSSLRQVGVLRNKQAQLNLIDQMKWRRYPQGGSIRITGSFGVLTIELGNFESRQREQLIARIRELITDSKQVGWQAFTEQYADTPQKRQRSRRAMLLLA